MMPKFLLPLLAAALLMLGACGRDESAWDYIAIGDSLAAGFGAVTSYPFQYAVGVRADTGADVRITNFGQELWTSDDLLRALREDEQMREAIRNAEIITWNIGGNDLRNARWQYITGECGGPENRECLRQTVERFKTNWDAILDELVSLRGTDQAALRTMTIYNPYVAEDRAEGRFDVFSPLVEEINTHIVTTTRERGIPIADVYQAFNGPSGDLDPSAQGYLTVDDLHPNDAGHGIIAELLRSLGYAPLR